MIFLITILANIWVHWIFQPLKNRKGIKKSLKPFDCEGCLSLWLTLIWYWITSGPVYGILLGSAAFFLSRPISYLFAQYLNKLYAKILWKIINKN